MATKVNVNKAGKTFYSCAICGSEHEYIEARNTCEAKCIKELRAAEELMKKQKLEEEKDARKKEIDDLYELINEKIKSYVKDYGSIRLNRAVRYDNNFNCPTLSDLFNFWSL
jgi:hypothetical protein